MATQALEANEVVVVLDKDDSVAMYRLSRWLKLGFNMPQAEVLAMTRDENGFWLYEDAAIELFARGCTHELAFDILSPLITS